MKHNRPCVFIVFAVTIVTLAVLCQPARAQKADKRASAEIAGAHQEKVKDLVAFLELLLNTLGSNTTSARDKEVVITESYRKIFRDDKVQIEDDLDEKRATITNKDVVAYLKDVDFFFENVTFELAIEDIKEGVNANGQLFYKVSVRRTLKGTTALGEQVNNTIPRYIEINYQPEARELKIVSVYTHEFDEKEALQNWWNSLSLEWKAIFRDRLAITDSVDLNDIKDMRSINDLDLSDNRFIQSIEPLGDLTNLAVLNLAGTGVSDLTPIRNLTGLVELDLAHTEVSDLSPLRYANKLTRLNMNNTRITSIDVLERMPELQNLEMQFTNVVDLQPLSQLASLRNLDLRGTRLADLTPVAPLSALMRLNVSKTPIRDVAPLRDLRQLRFLNVDSTFVRNLAALSALDSLEVLSANFTYITDLTALAGLPRLERVYCDQTPVNKAVADAFMAANPQVLVIFDSKDLIAWWQSLPTQWQRVLRDAAAIRGMPAKEELARVTNLDSLNFSNDRSITTLEPLHKLQKLRIIIANNTGITDLSPLADHRDVTFLDISDTEVADISVVSDFTNLQYFRADRSKIESIAPLFHLKKLKEVLVDRTSVHDIIAQEFLARNPRCLIVYKTVHLDRWWNNLSDSWRQLFYAKMGPDTTTTRENLHRLVEREEFKFENAPVSDLSALSEFVRLKVLHFAGTPINNIPDLGALRSLESLHATNSPLQQIGAISLMRELEDLDISNTPVDDLRGLEGMTKLVSFNCSGTQVKRLDPLRSLHQLQFLDCANTNVNKLDAVMYLSLETLKCYNTRISARRVDEFRENNPDCNVVYYR